MKPPRHIPLPLTVLLLTAVSLLSPPAPPVRADNTLRGKRLTLSSSSRDAIAGIKISPVTPPDTLRNPSRDSIQASGYDKPLRTNRETLLITNATARRLSGLALTLTYTDLQGRQLHRRTDTLHTDIPSGHTRMLRLATWDTQQSYYYHRSRCPRTANVTPYDVTCHIDFILLPPAPEH